MGLFSKLGKNKQESAGAGQDSGYYTSADDQTATERARSKRASSADGATRRRGRESSADDPVLPEKKRARRRLVGAVALALGVAVGLPMLLDSEPKPLSSDIDIKIPAKNKAATPGRAAPVAANDTLDGQEEIVEDAKPAAGATAAAAAPATGSRAVQAIGVESAKAEIDAAHLKAEALAKAEARAEAQAKAKSESDAKAKLEAERKREGERKLAEAKAEAKARAEAERKVDAKSADAKPAAPKPAADGKQAQDARALAILEGKSAANVAPVPAESGQKFVLQVAALSDPAKVEELRRKLKEAGISSYTQKAPSGEVTRVRVGPFTNKEEAEKVRAKLSGMGLSGRMETV